MISPAKGLKRFFRLFAYSSMAVRKGGSSLVGMVGLTLISVFL